jgi:hypothetical protein
VEKRLKVSLIYCCLLAFVSLGANFNTQARQSDEKGESKQERALKNRATAPRQADIDKAVTLDSLL